MGNLIEEHSIIFVKLLESDYVKSCLSIEVLCVETIISVGGEARSIVVFSRLMNSPKFMIIRVVVHRVNPSVFLWETRSFKVGIWVSLTNEEATK